VPVSRVAPMTEDVPTIPDVLEEADDDARDEDRSDDDALLEREAVDDVEAELERDALEADAAEELRPALELEGSSSLDVTEALVTDDSVLGEDAETVAATEAADAADAMIDVTWV
jgi:hypothetical protein